MDKKFPHIGIGVIAVREGQVLLGKRKGAHGAGEWAFPGGHLEWGETPEACAERELREETSLEAAEFAEGPWTNNLIGEKHYVTLFLFAKRLEGQVETREPEKCEEWKWFAWEALPKPLFATVLSLLHAEGVDALKKRAEEETR